MNRSTRGIRNEDMNRATCHAYASVLKKITPSNLGGKYVLKEVIRWLEEIEDGADPRKVILGDNPQRNDLHGMSIAVPVQREVDRGKGVNEAIRELAEDMGPNFDFDRIKRVYYRWRGKAKESFKPDYILRTKVMHSYVIYHGLSKDEAIRKLAESFGESVEFMEWVYLNHLDDIDLEDPMMHFKY